MTFELHPSLAKKDYICDLDFCKVLLEDNADYPWVFLVPKKNNVRNMLDLTTTERMFVNLETEIVEKAMTKIFNPTQTNIAMIGNITPQLHVHVICRFENDPLWPATVWGAKATKYEAKQKQEIIQKIKQAVEN